MSRHHRRGGCLGIAAMLVLCAQGVWAQEHSYAPSDIENGRGLYQANCLGCHGDQGSSVESVDLGSGRFRRATSDEELAALIRAGIAGTLMIPRPQFSDSELVGLVSFLRTMRAQTGSTVAAREVVLGNAGHGEELFFGSAGCGNCHGVGGGGSRLYVDLANIGGTRSPASLENSILYPDAEVREGQRFMQVVDKKGNARAGLLMNQDTHSIQVMSLDEKLVSFAKSDLKSWAFLPSQMPSSRDVLSSADVSDLVAYLVSLKKAE
ncbi:MAG: c-type cytochrome [Pseudomonadales bacterium]|jgi:putative heme-binding domain-containing protein|nr:c-type cytochrome [Pseudomonadales bacterium]